MCASPIEEYALLADGRSGALVGRDGSVDWWCPARFDGPSVFARLLDNDSGGHWFIRPDGEFDVERQYLDGTLVVRTVFTTRDGSVAITDGLALDAEARGHEIGHYPPGLLLREVEGLSGRVPMVMSYEPRFEYGRVRAHLLRHGTTIVARATGSTLGLAPSVPVDCRDVDASATFTVEAGRRETFSLSYSPTYHQREPMAVDVSAALADTVEAWRSWSGAHTYPGLYAPLVRHSVLVLQGLTYQLSGSVVAAATTSVPVTAEGQQTYDYRYVWLRDFSLTLRALSSAACPDEAVRLFRWMAEAIGVVGMEPVPIMVGVEGERDLSERQIDVLDGYVETGSVRLGNAAWTQRQHDILGQIVDAAWLLRRSLEPLPDDVHRLLRDIIKQAAQTWREPDSGVWEMREELRHNLTSKVSCWLALDRAVRFGTRLGSPAELRRWAAIRDEIRETILREGWNERVGAYTGAFDSDQLDASVLALPLVGFIRADDPRMLATVERIQRELTVDGLVRRWPGEPGGFLACSFWLVQCLALAGDPDRAAELFESLAGRANDVGLFAEQIDLCTGRQVGNFPQAFSHIGLIAAAWRLTETQIDRYSQAGKATS
ncbi:glycoside hydrolase family 15 protein [Plantactinospora sp. B24E8]|uniref:glycoside hydrolase family 15 protein n=1 Tax=Plantactinospora sp. B24E8 TaxID=3153567 RepID=UPI00325C5D44